MSQSQFVRAAHLALENPQLQKALHTARPGFIGKRAAAAARLPEFDALRDSARDIKAHTLAHLDYYLEEFARNCERAGGEVHWALDADEANNIAINTD